MERKITTTSNIRPKSAALTIERVMERRRQWNLYLKECALATRIQSIVRRRLGFNVVQKNEGKIHIRSSH